MSTNLRSITIDIQVGEYEHQENIFFLGTYGQAKIWVENTFLPTIWGPNTYWDPDELAWCTTWGDRKARLHHISEPLKSLACMNVDDKACLYPIP